MPDSSSNPSELQLVSQTGRAVKVAIPTVEVAREVFDRLEEADEPSSRRRSRYAGMIAGNPPYDDDVLRELNLGYVCNINAGEMRAILDQKAGAFLEMFLEVPTLAEFEFIAPPGETPENQPRDRWEEVVGEEFTRTLRDWPPFLTLIDQCRREADAYDIGLAMWRDPWDWRPYPVQRSCFLPEPHAKVDVDSWNLVGFSDTMTGYALLDIAENDKAAISEGWNIASVRNLLIAHYVSQTRPGTDQGSPAYAAISPWERLQVQIRNNEPSTISRMFDPIQIRHLFAREPLSGKISHLIFAPDSLPESEDENFLCERRDAYDFMHEVVWCLPFNWGGGYVKGIRGLASAIESHCDLSNRYLGRLYDAGMLSGTMILKPNSEMVDTKRLQMVRMGVMTLLPRGVDAVQSSSFTPPLAPLVQIRDLSSSVMQNNVGMVKRISESFGENQVQKSARQVAEESSKEARLERSSVAFDYVNIERLYREMFRRLTAPALLNDKTLPGSEEAATFTARCIARGVPAEYLNADSLALHATQAIGMGSWGVRLDIARQVLEGRGNYDEHGRTNAIRDWLGALVGQRNINRYKAAKTRDDIPSNESSIAVLENNDIQEGATVEVGTDQNHKIHFLKVAEILNQIVTEVQQSGGQNIGDPMKLIAVLESALSHATGHLQEIAQDPAMGEFVNQASGLLKAAQVTLDFIQKIAMKMQEAQQKEAEAQQAMLAEAQGVLADRDKQLEEQKALAKLEIEAKKGDSLVQMRKDRQTESAQVSREKMSFDSQLKAQKQAFDIAMEQQKAQAKMEVERMLASAKAAMTSARGAQ